MNFAAPFCYLTRGIALLFLSVAFILGGLPILIAMLFGYISEELEGEWRRGRQQTWLSEWARRQATKGETK